MGSSVVANPYPTDVEAHLVVEDELHVHFRALHTCEEAPIRSLYERLGTESRYRRFLSPMPSLPDTVVRDLACVDHCRSLAIVAEDEAHNREVIALASYAAVDETTAEVAIAVQDDWQGHGVGTALAGALLDAAERRGFQQFAATLSAENVPIRRILNRVGRVVTSRTSAGISELVFVTKTRET
jgi:acetyltransferase